MHTVCLHVPVLAAQLLCLIIAHVALAEHIVQLPTDSCALLAFSPCVGSRFQLLVSAEDSAAAAGVQTGTQLNRIITTILKSFSQVMYLSLLLLLFMFVFALMVSGPANSCHATSRRRVCLCAPVPGT